MILVGWISLAVGALLALGLAVLASIVRGGARDASDRRLGRSLIAGALLAVAFPTAGVALGRHGHPTLAWGVAVATLALGGALLVALPRVVSAAAQP